MQKRSFTNERIRAEKVQLIDETGKNIGVIEKFKAINMATVKGLDLVQVSDRDVPVCRIMDYSKYRYMQAKKNKGTKHVSTLKEIRFRPHTDDHDIEVKVGKAKKFLAVGDKVKMTIFFRGRENIFKKEGYKQMERIQNILSDVARMESSPQLFGKRLIALFVKNR
ncbi:MAG: translation initiation factor IF-3 [bacterium]